MRRPLVGASAGRSAFTRQTLKTEANAGSSVGRISRRGALGTTDTRASEHGTRSHFHAAVDIQLSWGQGEHTHVAAATWRHENGSPSRVVAKTLAVALATSPLATDESSNASSDEVDSNSSADSVGESNECRKREIGVEPRFRARDRRLRDPSALAQ